MSKRERVTDAIMELMVSKHREQGGICPACFLPVALLESELAHFIPQRNWAIKRWGADVIHHPLNMALTHRGTCNSRMQLNPNGQVAELRAQRIRAIINGGKR
jgi:hypothetical protein